MKVQVHFFLFILVLLVSTLTRQAPKAAEMSASSGWELIPAGAKRAYKGIHGGTMPVSLLVSPDGQSLFTFVGRTGNDFLQLLRETDVPIPTLLNAPITANAMNRGRTMHAGNSARSLPVRPLVTAGEGEAPLTHFGLSEKPLSIEGEVERPDNSAGMQRFRLSFNRLFFQPRRGNAKVR